MSVRPVVFSGTAGFVSRARSLGQTGCGRRLNAVASRPGGASIMVTGGDGDGDETVTFERSDPARQTSIPGI